MRTLTSKTGALHTGDSDVDSAMLCVPTSMFSLCNQCLIGATNTRMEPSVAIYWTCRSILSFTNKSQLTDWASGVHNAITADLGDATDGLPGDCGPNTSMRGACCSLFL